MSRSPGLPNWMFHLAVLGACITLAGCRGCSSSQPASESNDSQTTTTTTTTTTTQPADQANQSPPVVTVSGTEARHDLGQVPPGSGHTVVFVVDNPADTPITFRTVRPDCECISAKDAPKGIEPHGSVRITVRYVAPSKAMDYESRILIVTDDPARRIISLRVRSEK